MHSGAELNFAMKNNTSSVYHENFSFGLWDPFQELTMITNLYEIFKLSN
jgi:hypothetical protein